MKARFWLVSYLCVSAAACASGGSGGTSATAGYTRIDDMEGAGDVIEWSPPSGRPGRWFSATDCNEGDRISPPPYFVDRNGWSYATLPGPQQTFPGMMSTHAARLQTTSPLGAVWGANMGIGFAAPDGDDGADAAALTDAGAGGSGQPCRQPTSRDIAGVPTDLSAYSGVTFWAMALGTGAQEILFKIGDKDTDPRAGVCNAADPSNETNCYNAFGTVLTLTDTLTRYTVDLSSLQQNPRWGYRPTPSVLDLQNVYTMAFEVNQVACATSATAMCAGGSAPPLSFDIWIDDLYFVNR